MLQDCHIDIYKSIKKYIKIHGYSPSIRDLKELCQYKSTSTVYNHLKILEKAGYIKMDKKTSRSIKIV